MQETLGMNAAHVKIWLPFALDSLGVVLSRKKSFLSLFDLVGL